MPSERIQVDYDRLEAVARQFDEQSEAVEQWTRRVRAAQERLLRCGWEGQAANAFHNEMENDVLPGLDRLAKALCQAQETASQVARVMQAAEEESASLFRQGEDGRPVQSEPGVMPGGSVGDGFGGESSWSQVTQEDFNWLQWQKDLANSVIDLIVDVVVKKFPVVGIPLAIFKIAKGTMLDEDFPQNWPRALVGEVAGWGAGEVVGLVGKMGKIGKLIGTFAKVGEGAQLPGHLVVGESAREGYVDEALWLQDGLDKLDPGAWGENIAEGIYDFIPQIPEKIENAVNSYKENFVNRWPSLGEMVAQ